MDQWISLLCGACAAVGCALPSSHPNAEELRCSASRAPLWAARCLIGMPENFVALQRARRCGLRIAFVASASRRISLLCSAHAAVGCVLRLSHPHAEEYRRFAQRARRCGLRVAFVASECRRISLLCNACAAVSHVLDSVNCVLTALTLLRLPEKKSCSQKPQKRKEFGRLIDFVSIGPRVLIGLCFFL